MSFMISSRESEGLQPVELHCKSIDSFTVAAELMDKYLHEIGIGNIERNIAYFFAVLIAYRLTYFLSGAERRAHAFGERTRTKPRWVEAVKFIPNRPWDQL
jgi:hypothetical protein